jgi:hypothetical protein
MHYASYQIRSEIVQKMLDSGVDSNTEAFDSTALYAAAASGDLQTMKILYSRGPR